MIEIFLRKFIIQVAWKCWRQRENMKYTIATAFVAEVLQFCWKFEESPFLFYQNARQEWAYLTDLQILVSVYF